MFGRFEFGRTSVGNSTGGNWGNRLFDLLELWSVSSWGLVKPPGADSVAGRREVRRGMNGGCRRTELVSLSCLSKPPVIPPGSRMFTDVSGTNEQYQSSAVTFDWCQSVVFGSALGEGASSNVIQQLNILIYPVCTNFIMQILTIYINTTFVCFFSRFNRMLINKQVFQSFQ